MRRKAAGLLICAITLLCVGCGKSQSTIADETRVEDVLHISYRLMIFKLETHRFPQALKDMEEVGTWRVPVDPVSQAPYEYMVLDANSYELCAVFDKANELSDDAPAGIRYGDPMVHSYGRWVHGAARQCVQRALPEL